MEHLLVKYYMTLFVVALFATWWIFKRVLKISLMKNIVDNPEARKLQKIPVPVLGGIAVFFGIAVALTVTKLTFDTNSLFPIMGVMTIMLYTGIMDDILNLTPRLRLLVEVLVILLLMFTNDYSINDFHGLWGIYRIPEWIAVPLTIIACVGIINAINLIDGVNGLCSGYCILACSIFAIAFIIGDDRDAASLAIVSIGALIPFFFHNVFGLKSKMFLGDGGTLMMGAALSSMVIGMLNVNSPLAEKVDPNFGLIPFALSILVIPVFDCLRVMISRMLRRTSPFYPDKTHLHHLLWDMGFSHIGVTSVELLGNAFVVLAWYISYRSGASVDVQLYIVFGLGMMITLGFYTWARRQEKKESKIYHVLQSIGRFTHFGHTPWFERLRTLLDRRCEKILSDTIN